MAANINELPLVKASIHEPLFGVWFADVEVDTEEAPAGRLIMAVEGVSFVGAVWNGRSGVDGGRWVARIAGGAASMGADVDAKNYVGVNLRALVDDLMNATGETLDVSSSDSDVLARIMSRWHRMAGTAGNAMAALLDEAASTYRVQRSGEVKIGAEDFAELELGDEALPELDEAMSQNSVVYAPVSPLVRPGVTIERRSVEYVWTQVTGGSLRQTAWFADA